NNSSRILPPHSNLPVQRLRGRSRRFGMSFRRSAVINHSGQSQRAEHRQLLPLNVVDLKVLNCLKAMVAGEVGELPRGIPGVAGTGVNERLFGSEHPQSIDSVVANKVGVVAGAVAANQRKTLAFRQKIQRW